MNKVLRCGDSADNIDSRVALLGRFPVGFGELPVVPPFVGVCGAGGARSEAEGLTRRCCVQMEPNRRRFGGGTVRLVSSRRAFAT